MVLMWTSFWGFSLLTGLLTCWLHPAAAETPSDLTCSCTKQSDGNFIYELSRPPRLSGLPSCTVCWEDQNQRNLGDSPANMLTPMVRNLTDQFIILKDCQDYLRYMYNCLEGIEEAECRVNCSRLLDEDHHGPTVNSTLTCIFGSWCPSQQTVGIGITGILVLAGVVFGVLYIWKLLKRRRGGSAAMATSYTPANEQIKLMAVEIGQRPDMVQHNSTDQ
ncbi:uncharacterized protein [Enoplosus armatus]|uniref:uncharacterized protein n=1 Tax=Enoplosus armatus TaxID=215367 RepID=UPI003993802A